MLHPDGPQEKLERNAVQIEQSTARKFVCDTVTRTIPQPRKEVATAETSREGNQLLCRNWS